jgi:hypothetical protein
LIKQTERDDGPEPVRMTPRRVADRLHRMGLQLARLQLELRTLAPYLERGPIEHPHDLIRTAASAVVDLGTAVRVGQVALVPDYLDGRHTPPRPLLDVIELHPLELAARAVVERLEGRGDTDPQWEGAVAKPDPAVFPNVKAHVRKTRKAKAKDRSKPVGNGTLAPADWTPAMDAAVAEFSRRTAAKGGGS